MQSSHLGGQGTTLPAKIAIIIALAASLPAEAQFFSSTGANGSYPVNLFPINPASPVLDFTGNVVSIGGGSAGTFSAINGAVLRADSLAIGENGTGNGLVTVSGLGTSVFLVGSGGRLAVGNFATGALTVSAGAVVDAATAPCPVGAFCGSAVAAWAGSTGTLTVTGAGSQVSVIRNFNVGQAIVATVALDGFAIGTPGGTSNAFVNVLNGGAMNTESVIVGLGTSSPGATGFEQAFGTVVVDGANSRWLVSRNVLDNTAAGLTIGSRIGGHGAVNVTNGGKLVVDGKGISPTNDFINVGVSGGTGSLTVSGVGSSIEVKGTNPIINIGRSGATGQGAFSVLAGATASSLYMNLGRDGATGTLLVDGPGSQLSLVGIGSTGNGGAGSFVGQNGTGIATVSNGGRWIIGDGGGDGRAAGTPGMTIGREAGSSGSLTITGAGSRVEMTSTSLSPVAGVADNPNVGMTIGNFAGSTGELNITNGGKLLMQGNAISTVANERSTSLQIGGGSDLSAGTGKALVSGSGSEIRITGSDAYIGVGRGTGGIGELKVENGGSVTAAALVVGRAGGIGTLTLDGGIVNLSGQFTGPTQSGAVLSLGQGGGVGTANITNGSRVDITNFGSAGANLVLGGSAVRPTGDGSLILSAASQINIAAASGLAAFTVGRDGTGFALLRESSSVSVGDGATYVGRLAGSSGTLVMQSGATLNSAYVGVGRNQGGDGGSGTLLLSNSVINTTTLEVGSGGFLGGNNGTINGNVILHGVLSPGESPGRININGGFKTGSGHLILDIARAGDGFDIDHVVLTKGSTFSFTGLEITFNFLAGVDATQFAEAGGLDLDNFLQSFDPVSGAVSGLSGEFKDGETWSTLLATATFDAVSGDQVLTNLVVGTNGTVSFNVAAVPEPETWAMMLFGLSAMAGFARRRRATSEIAKAEVSG